MNYAKKNEAEKETYRTKIIKSFGGGWHHNHERGREYTSS